MSSTISRYIAMRVSSWGVGRWAGDCFFMGCSFLAVRGKIKKEGGTIATLIPRNGGWGLTTMPPSVVSVGVKRAGPAPGLLPRPPTLSSQSRPRVGGALSWRCAFALGPGFPVDWPSCFLGYSIAHFQAFAKRFLQKFLYFLYHSNNGTIVV